MNRRAVIASFLLLLNAVFVVFAAPTHLVEQSPVSVTNVAEGIVLVDFGRVAFGNLKLTPPLGATNSIKVHFGEAFANGRINRKPPGSVRYAATNALLTGKSIVLAPAADARNTEQFSKNHPPTILTPAEWGVVLPFRWVEIEGWPGVFSPDQIKRRAAFASTWDDDAAAFLCSDKMLNQIWELCRYSIKATTFAGIYVDGDRERIPYEADAYLNQLSHYATDHDTQMARDTFDHLMRHGTWPTEWAPHLVFMAHADWMHTGDTNWLAARYESLKSKLLLERVGEDGLVRSEDKHIKRDDIVDWPVKERDGFVFTERNTVVNAFYLRALQLMVEMGKAIGREPAAAEFSTREAKASAAFQKMFFDAQRGLYRDGVNTDHASLHANLFPLAFGLVAATNQAHIAAWLAQRGMKCSVYAAQYLLEGLFAHGQDDEALKLMAAPGDPSWRHMVVSGTTITWEAWDQKYKPNQDWNHAWGAAPANLLPRFVLGVQPRSPGWEQVLIRPNCGSLLLASGKVPTPRGPVLVDWKNEKKFTLTLTLPPGVSAQVELPGAENSTGVFSGARQIAAQKKNSHWILTEPVSGTANFEVR